MTGREANRSGAGALPIAEHECRPALEAVLMIADQPLDSLVLAQAVGAPPDAVARTLHALAREYTENGRGFDLRQVGGGWRFYSRAEHADVVEQFLVESQQARLTAAALETLAVVAYRQPVTRGRVSGIRGVNVDGVMRTLVTRGLVEEAGTDAESGAHLFRTTAYFLERMGLTRIEQMPEIAPFLPEITDLDVEIDAASPHSPGVSASGVSAPGDS